jgi:hypothetical protein
MTPIRQVLYPICRAVEVFILHGAEASDKNSGGQIGHKERITRGD